MDEKACYELFDHLLEWGENNNSFSIRDFAKLVGIPYKTIQELSKLNEDWEHAFDKTQNRLACNAENAHHHGMIQAEEWSRYVYENDYFIRESMREEDGIIVPEDTDEFDKWFEIQYKKDKRVYGL